MPEFIDRKLVIECCKAISDRDDNGGVWIGGKIPDCIQLIMKRYGSNFLVVSQEISKKAIKIVANEIKE